MKKIAMMLLACVALSACETKEKVREEVREVEVTDTLVDDGYGPHTYTPGETFDSEAPELYVDLLDVQSNESFRIDLGGECAQFPLPRGQRFMARFDVTRHPSKPSELYMAPQTQPIYGFLCGG